MATTNKNFRVKNGLDVNGEINASAVGGDEGGQINLQKPATGTTLSGNVSIDVYQNKIRIFDSGGTARGAYIDLSAAAEGVGSNLLAGGGGGITSVAEDTSPTLGGDLDAAGFDITNLNSLTLDTTPTSPGTATGTIFWDSGDGIPKAILNANVTIGLGQESVITVKNATGSTITKGTVVYINGAQGQMPTVALADADTEATSSKTFGFAAEEILDTAEGFIVTEGVLRGVNTASFTEGGAIWLSSTAGQYTQTIPAEPAHSVFLGYAVKAHASAGEVIVKIQNGYELTELHGVEISGTPADNEVLAYDTTSGLWINQTAEEAGVANLSGATFTGNVAGTNANLSGNVNATTFSGSGAGLISIPSIVTDDTKPSTPVDGQVWFNSATGKTYVYYEDGTSGQWVEIFGAKDVEDLKNRTTIIESEISAIESNITNIQESSYVVNYLINGGFDVWQRGTSFVNVQDGYIADRWYLDKNGTTNVYQTSSSIPSGFNYAMQLESTTSADYCRIYQALESSTVIPLRGKTMTFSVYLKMDSNMQSLESSFNIVADYSTSTDARASQTTSIGTQTLDKSLYGDWVRATYTFTVPTDAVGLRIGIEPPVTETIISSATYWITGAMLEVGTVATPFQRNSPNIQAELAACQRYYVRFTGGNGYGLFGHVTAANSTQAYAEIYLPVPMRISPTTLDWTGTIANYVLSPYAYSSGTLSSFAIWTTYQSPTSVLLQLSGSGWTTNGGYLFSASNNSAAYIGFSAEL